MERNLDTSAADCEALGKKYLAVLNLADALFDGRPFSLRLEAEDFRPLAGIYDGVMVALGEILDHGDLLLKRKKVIQQRYVQVVNSQSHRGALTGVASTSSDIKARIKVFRDIFAEFV